ncbi:MAG: hypothetical protein OXF62_02240 [Caldilineaceae bacterium]|nr:hypothetical protein [Caldilineaceae bacterium]
MNGSGAVLSFLWTPGRRRLIVRLQGNDREAGERIQEALAASGEVRGRIAGRGVKIERHPASAQLRGVFAPVFYGLLADDGDHCRLAGHIQLHPVGRLYIGAWILLGTLLALALLVAAALRATPASGAREALPLVFPVLLPFLGLAFASWQRRRGRADERAMRAWLDSLEKGHLDRAPD